MTFIEGNSIIHRLDPRIKIVFAFLFAFVVALSQRFLVLTVAFLFAALLVRLARLPVQALWQPLIKLNLVMGLLWLFLPIMTPSSVSFPVLWFELGRTGIMLAAAITLKGNAIVLSYTALLGTIEMTALGHALVHLRIPAKLAHLFLFTVRYVDVLHHEYERLIRAMKVRCFQPRMSLHTYRAYANLIGLLLIKSLDRSERIVGAMKCRGFNGTFRVLHHFSWSFQDFHFGLMASLCLLALIGMELGWVIV